MEKSSSFVFLALGLLAIGVQIMPLEAACDSDSFGENCYKAMSASLTKDQALAKCDADKAHLASVHGPEEQKFLIDLAIKADPTKKNQFWIGLLLVRNLNNKKLLSMAWDGRHCNQLWQHQRLRLGTDTPPWAITEPNGDGRDTEFCVVLAVDAVGKNFGWKDYPCNAKYGYICKK